MATDKVLMVVPFDTPGMETSVYRTRIPKGMMEEAIGIDGRFRGSYRNFPGFVRIKKLQVGAVDISSVNFFHVVDAPQPAGTGGNYRVRGYIVRHGTTITFFRYKESSSTWDTLTVASAISTTCKIGVTVYGSMIIVVLDDAAGTAKIFQSTAAAVSDFSAAAWATEGAAPDYDAGGDADVGGYMRYGRYMFAYRYVDETTGGPGTTSNMSGVLIHDISDTEYDTHLIGIKRPAAQTPPAAATHVELYRSISVEVAGSVYEGGVLYKEKKIAIAAWTTGTIHTMGTLSDEQLVMEDRLDPVLDTVGTAPRTAIIHTHQGVLFMEGENGESIRWSNVRKGQPENFNALNKYPMSPSSGRMLKIITADDNVYVLCESSIYKLTLAGTRILIKRAHANFGLASYRAIDTLGPDVVFMAGNGLAVLNGGSGEILGVTSSRRIVDLEGWTSGTIHIATDAALGVTFVLGGNYPGITDDEEAGDGCILLWHETKVMNMLVGMGGFVAAAGGTHPENGGADRAQFITSDGIVVTPNLDLTVAPTMLGVAGTVNGTTTSGGTTNLVDSTAAFDATAVGARVYLIDSDAATYTVRKVKTWNSGTSLELMDLSGNAVTVAVDTKYTISPVPCRITPPPMGGDFERTIVKSLSLCNTWNSSDATNGLVRLSVLTGDGGRRLQADMGDDNALREMKSLGEMPERTTVSLNRAHPRITAQVEIVCAGARFELTGLQMGVILTDSRRSKVPE